jgi:hypothetical protein
VQKRTKILLIGATIAAAAVFPAIARAGNASRGEAGDGGAPITGSDLVRASEVALDHLGEGTVTGTEVGDEESLYEVEVTFDDGTRVDVQLDEEFNVVGNERDGVGDDD